MSQLWSLIFCWSSIQERFCMGQILRSDFVPMHSINRKIPRCATYRNREWKVLQPQNLNNSLSAVAVSVIATCQHKCNQCSLRMQCPSNHPVSTTAYTIETMVLKRIFDLSEKIIIPTNMRMDFFSSKRSGPVPSFKAQNASYFNERSVL